MHRYRDDFGVTKVEEVSHNLSHLTVSQLILHEGSQPFVGQGLLSLLGYLLPNDLWLGPKLSDDV